MRLEEICFLALWRAERRVQQGDREIFLGGDVSHREIGPFHRCKPAEESSELAFPSEVPPPWRSTGIRRVDRPSNIVMEKFHQPRHILLRESVVYTVDHIFGRHPASFVRCKTWCRRRLSWGGLPMIWFVNPAIPNARLRGDVDRVRRVVAQLPPQLPNVDPQVVALFSVASPPHAPQQPLMREQLPGVRHHRFEQTVLRRRHMDRLTVALDQTPLEIDL